MRVAPCKSWFRKAAILSQSCLAIHFLEDAFAGAWRFNPLRRIIAFVKAFSGTAIPFRRMPTFAAVSAILMCSSRVTKFVQHLRIRHRSDLFGEDERSEAELNLFDENVEITIRIDDQGLDVLQKPRWVVKVHLPKERPQGAGQTVRNTTDNGAPHYKGQDHKVPFWVR